MSARLKWTDRKFNFDFPVLMYPDLIERVRGTPARCEDIVRDVSTEVLTRRDGQTWSAQENIGHLIDLEHLHIRRVDDFLSGAEVLPAADPANRRTFEAGYNQQPIDEVLRDFRAVRGEFVERLESLDESDFSRSSLHPRLNTPMRLVDMTFFTAEHDDYHLVRVTELIRKFSRRATS